MPVVTMAAVSRPSLLPSMRQCSSSCLTSSGVKNLDVSRSLVGASSTLQGGSSVQQCISHMLRGVHASWHKQCRTSAALLWCRPRSP
jgi:hypothetical protein